MKIRRRSSSCPNCGSSISEVYNYCPNCGQENTTTNLSFGILFREFFSNYFSLDSRFGRSIKPFLIRPGHLTNAFNEGKRVMFAHPVRLYLVISLFHFFLFAWYIDDDQDTNTSDILQLSEQDRIELDSIMGLPGNTRPYDPDSWPVQDWELSLIAAMHQGGHEADEIMDSLGTEDRTFMEVFMIKRTVRLSNADTGDLAGLIIENIPIMMFFILPLYALLLKLFYLRKGLYIHHLIHTLHIHSFLFFILGVSWLYLVAVGQEGDLLILVGFLLTSIYIVMSLKRVYKQRWRVTILKFFTIGFLYCLLLSFAILLEVLASLAMY